MSSAEYGSSRHWVKRLKSLKRWVLIAASLSPAWAVASPELARSQGCMGCHAVDQKVVGPAFNDVAKRYGVDAAAIDKMAQRIVSGSSGVWGPVAMPAQPLLKADEALVLARWVLSSGKAP